MRKREDYVYHVYAMQGEILANSEEEADYWDVYVYASEYDECEAKDPIYEFEYLNIDTRNWLIANVISQFACEGEWVYG